jgi:hypothetical protein
LPWCDDCSKFWNAPELAADGECPTCGRVLTARAKRKAAVPVASPAGASAGATAGVSVGAAPGSVVDGEPSVETADDGESVTRVARTKGAPWHFKVMVIGVTVYMIYRIYWLIEWLPKHV